MREQLVDMVKEAIKTGDYNLIRQAMRICPDDVFMAEDDEFVMVDDEVFYFNGAF